MRTFRGAGWLLGAGIVTLCVQSARAEDPSVKELQRQLKAMQAQLQQLQDKMQKQQQLIDKLSAEKGAPVSETPVAAAAAATPPEEKLKQEITEQVERDIQPALSAANKTFPSQFNPAIGLIIDTVASYQEHGGGNFEFRTAELGLSASVDPFVRGYAILNFGPDEVEAEEAALVTTSLPYNLALKGGRFFADFGRLSKFHDHDLPFVNRPIVLDEYVGGESQADGVEGSYLLPLNQYVTVTAGAYNKMGAANSRVDNLGPRPLSEFTYLVHPTTFISLNDANSVDVGVSYAYTPRVDSFSVDNVEFLRDGKLRNLGGIDITYRYIPLGQASYRGLVWGTEVLLNHETWNTGTDLAPDFTPETAVGLYSYVEPRIWRWLYAGFLFQWVQSIDRQSPDTLAYAPYLTMWASEFQRIRLQYQYLDAPGNHESQFFLQWTGILGSHVHGFRDR
jgi:hypothetical protein